ncbi:Lactose and galactose permease, GPH translocator family [Levilactobacillus brevis]|nr:Lactose and galactose permease, GPH translocator family [Levilactobacillus brevis]
MILDIFYSFKDIAFWSMLPALSVDSGVRNRFGTIARFGSTLGAQGVAIVIMPLVIFFSQTFSGTHGNTQTRAGWLGFAVVIGAVSLLGALATFFGTKEKSSLIRENTEKTRLRDVFKVLGENDQLMWLSLSYFLFALGYVVTNSLLVYYFRYVIGKPNEYSIVGVITAVLGVISVPLFPVLVRLVTRKGIYVGGIAMMIIGYILFMLSGTNVAMILIADAIFFFPYPMIFLAALMTITDSVEYGQWKNGVRNESVTLAVRPLIDKLAGAFSMGIVVLAAVNAGMTGNTKPSEISAHGLFIFHSFIFYIPLVLIAVAALIYQFKISLSEKRHAEIVKEIEAKLEAQEAKKEN